MFDIVMTQQAFKDKALLKMAKLDGKARALLEILRRNPFQNPPPYEKLVGDFAGAYLRRINLKHRLVYQVFVEERVVKVIRMWTHCE